MTMPQKTMSREALPTPAFAAVTRPAPFAMFLLALAGVVSAAVALRWMLPFNVDVSWWLIVSERMLDGQRLYVDILETNPPMAAAVYLVGTVLARAFAVRPEVATNAFIFAMIAASLATTCWILRRSMLRETPAMGALILLAALLLCVLPMYDFGQREHLALVTLLPALGVLMLRADQARVSWPMILIAGVCAGVTVSFKPYFAAVLVSTALAAAYHARRWRVVFAPENWIAATLVVLYGVATYVVFPEYFTVIYPLVRDVYLLLRAPLLAIALTSAMLLSIGATLLVFLLRNGRRLDSALVVMLAAAFGFAVAFVVQSKGWGYHAYPMVALALMAAGYAIATLDADQSRSRVLRCAALLALAALFANACVWTNASVDVAAIEREVARIHPRPKLMVLSAAAVIGHPLVRTLDGEWISRQEAFWVREIVRRAVLDGEIDAPAAARLADYIARERDGIVADFRKQPPDVVLIDNHNSDWGAWAAADPELCVLLAPYTRSETIDGIEIRSRP